MSRLPCSFCLCSLATNIADIFFHYLYYTAEHQAEQWRGSLVHNIKCTCFSILAIHPMFENTGILALSVKSPLASKPTAIIRDTRDLLGLTQDLR